jgi:DNA-binding response OmpR family regulator
MEDESYLELLQCFLWDHGMEVEVAAGAPECRAILREFAPDVVIAERDLPWGGSHAVLAGMDDDPQLHKVPVILIANSRVECDLVDHWRVVGRLQRPFRLNDALGLIRYAVWRARSTRTPAGANS